MFNFTSVWINWILWYITLEYREKLRLSFAYEVLFCWSTLTYLFIFSCFSEPIYNVILVILPWPAGPEQLAWVPVLLAEAGWSCAHSRAFGEICVLQTFSAQGLCFGLSFPPDLTGSLFYPETQQWFFF